MKGKPYHLFVLVILVGGTVFGQGTTGAIRVHVQTQDESVLPRASIQVRSPEALGTRTGATDENGVATLTGLDPSAVYVVTVTLGRFNTACFEDVLVKAGQTTTLRASLALAPVQAEIEVVAESPTVDFASAISGQDITLQLTESLPTGRTYQSYLQLVPGVLPTDPSIADENPAVRSGLNYADRGGEIGRSRDNFYYIEGIDVTDAYSGLFGADVNTEIIQEQNVMTGGIPAEFVGAPGLVSSVVTKSGGNQLRGSLSYYFQSDALVEENENAEAADFTSFDTAFTLGGPIARDRLWFFTSYRMLSRKEEVSSLETGRYLRTVTTESDQAFLKLSYSPVPSIKIVGTYLSDPTETDGNTDRLVLNNRSFTEETGGDRYILSYSQVLGPAFLSLSVGKHNGELSNYPADPSVSNTAMVRAADLGEFSLADQYLGGSGARVFDERDNNLAKGAIDWYVGTGWGDHTLTLGAEHAEAIRRRDSRRSGGASYTSVHPRYAGVPAGELWVPGWSPSWMINDSFLALLIDVIDASPNAAYHHSILDGNGDGVISPPELLLNLVFDSTEGNPHGMVNHRRSVEISTGAQRYTAKAMTFYLQDSFRMKRLTVNAGLRAEQWRHYATSGERIFTFDWEVAPRVGVIYDLTGAARHKLSLYYGRYYDPIRMNMTDFAGTLIGPVTESQLFVNGEWLTLRVSGGPQHRTAYFAPTTKTPYTDDLQLGYQVELGRNMSLEALAIRRRTRDIMEDYDLCLYAYCADGSSYYTGDTTHPGTLWLGLGYFGYDANPGSDFVIATLAGGERDWQGLELVFRKRYSDSWQMLASYTYANASGNTNSDSNADFQGDVLALDPRAPNMYARQPGLIEHLAKVAGSYSWDNGLQVGGTYRWSSGTVASRAWNAFNRDIPVRDDPYEWNGATTQWVAEDSVGAFENDAWGTLDLRALYRRRIGRVEGELFLDVFNALNDQAAVRNENKVTGTAATEFDDPIQWVPPRRFYLGVRLSF
jgi:hypothetical protein